MRAHLRRGANGVTSPLCNWRSNARPARFPEYPVWQGVLQMRRIAAVVVIVLLGSKVFAQSIHGRDGIALPPPPVAEADPVIDNYFGTKITDNYRWLEDAKSTETRDFIDAAERLHHALSEAGPHPQSGRRRSRPARAHLPLVNPHPARRQLLLHEAPRRRRAGLHLHAPRLDRRCLQKANHLHPKTSASSIPPPSAATPTPLSASPTSPATACSLPTRCARAAPTRPRSASTASPERSRSKTNSPPASTTPSTSPPTAKVSTTRAPTAKARCSTCTPSAPALADDKLIFGREFHGELLGPIDLFRAEITDDARYLVITIERGVPAKRVDICLPRSHQARFALRSSRLGTRLAFLHHLCQGRLVRSHRLQLAQRPHPPRRSRHHARGMEDHRARRQGRHRRPSPSSAAKSTSSASTT